MSFSDTKLRMLLILILIGFITVGLPVISSHAQSADISWKPPINVSNSEDKISIEPFLLADPSGVAHLFWAEQIANITGNQPDTLMYASWDGRNWSKPVDLFIPPSFHTNPQVHYPTAAIDNQGVIHLIWLMTPNPPNYSLYYSSVPANQAGLPRAWKPPQILADDLTGTNYSIDIKIDSNQNIHVIYARVPQGDTPPEQRAVSYIRSTDGGKSWSESVDLFTVSNFANGASNTRLLVEAPNKIFAVWTEWGPDGNGQAIYFDRSLDNGQNWENPLLLTRRIGNEYERDWPSLAILGGNQLVVFWEGGWRAYRYARYSTDAGLTWSDPVDTFPWLIGENGSAEFAYDSLNRLHVFVAQRIREGNVERSGGPGLWHSVWEGEERWQDPTLSGGVIPMVNPKVVILGGNKVVATWYSNTNFEVTVMNGVIQDAPASPITHWPTITPKPLGISPSPISKSEKQTPVPTMGPLLLDEGSAGSSTKNYSNPGLDILFGVLPSLILVLGFVIVKKYLR